LCSHGGFGSIDEAPDDFCRTKVGECDLFICMAGPLYGSRSPAGTSFTEHEFDAAILGKKPCLVFMTAEDYPLAANRIEADEERKCQFEFRKKVSKGRITTRFSTADEVSVRVVQAIRNWEAARAGNPAPTQEVLLTSQIHSVSYRIAMMNESTTVSDEEVAAVMAALQIQVCRDLEPAWGINAELTFIPKHADVPPASGKLVIEDDSRHPEMVSYHTHTADGLPEARVSVGAAKQAQWRWTMSASHELLEMLVN
jgi:hypothetical protein